ncbi:MAG: hypothetical protein ACYCQI_15170 [Gammaproteobacteria bacterium]
MEFKTFPALGLKETKAKVSPQAFWGVSILPDGDQVPITNLKAKTTLLPHREFTLEPSQVELCGTMINNTWIPLKTSKVVSLVNIVNNAEQVDLLEQECKTPISVTNFKAAVGISTDSMLFITDSPESKMTQIYRAKLNKSESQGVSCHYELGVEIPGQSLGYQISPDGNWLLILNQLKTSRCYTLINTRDLQTTPLEHEKLVLLSSCHIGRILGCDFEIYDIKKMLKNGLTEATRVGVLSNVTDDKDAGKYADASFSPSAKWLSVAYQDEMHSSLLISSFEQNTTRIVYLIHINAQAQSQWLSDDTLILLAANGRLYRFDPQNNMAELICLDVIKGFTILNETQLVVHVAGGSFKVLKLEQHKSELLAKLEESLVQMPAALRDIIHGYAEKISFDQQIAKVGVLGEAVSVSLPVRSGWRSAFFTDDREKRIAEQTNLIIALKDHVSRKAEIQTFDQSVNEFLKISRLNEFEATEEVRNIIKRIRELDLVNIPRRCQVGRVSRSV